MEKILGSAQQNQDFLIQKTQVCNPYLYCSMLGYCNLIVFTEKHTFLLSGLP